ncbi:MAG: tRNA/rRNA methyltransferase [Candidatus Kaiserbacteria bacterium GW2011_GWA2_49_19]|uniref:tRNA/rRNA methyltransferase n=1 Tax=Candidatus Kaiserbacteria bacterium GW2011_GWA2_49_19 TaxID=1618669 RepID=A0A0G1VSB2_9BACT|nr:MAG: tRNA/rRNA methyltransferase [Candidatus Kaiserbacteria bacterium GW2011_GWA2_49_19]
MTEKKFVLILPNIRSGHNVGAMFRTADGAGVDKIFPTGYSPCPPHPQVDKVSLGAEKAVPWEYFKQSGRLVKILKADGYRIIGLEQTNKSVNIYSWQPRFPLALIVGNEKTGISPGMLKLCDAVVHLPMRGMKKSLNVSIAAGVALYYISESV